jgi:hypothetical protein
VLPQQKQERRTGHTSQPGRQSRAQPVGLLELQGEEQAGLGLEFAKLHPQGSKDLWRTRDLDVHIAVPRKNIAWSSVRPDPCSSSHPEVMPCRTPIPDPLSIPSTPAATAIRASLPTTRGARSRTTIRTRIPWSSRRSMIPGGFQKTSRPAATLIPGSRPVGFSFQRRGPRRGSLAGRPPGASRYAVWTPTGGWGAGLLLRGPRGPVLRGRMPNFTKSSLVKPKLPLRWDAARLRSVSPCFSAS